MNLWIFLLSLYIYNCVKTLIFYVEFTKKIILCSLFTPWIFIRKFINSTEHFLRERVTHHIKRLLKGRDTCKTNRDEQGEVGSNIGNFENALGKLSHITLRNKWLLVLITWLIVSNITPLKWISQYIQQLYIPILLTVCNNISMKNVMKC